MMVKQLPCFLLCLSFWVNDVFAQLTETEYRQIDSIFLDWNQPNHPGGVIGVRKGSENVFLKAYGLASLDYLVPNQTSTIFNLASVTKQFTAMGILLLEREGKLSVDDKISKYIPNLTAIGDKITIRHMLHHTSGIRSFHELLFYAGWRGSDYRTNEDIYRLMESQEDLNFEPGAEYMYCNTGYIYMAYIIEKITGEPFPTWMKNNVFVPLGMLDTYVEDKPSRVVPQNATSYYGDSRAGFERAIDYWAYVGSGNMHATAEDLLAWGQNFYDPKPGWGDLFERLQTTDPFNDGTRNNYAFGVSIGDAQGKKVVSHGGSIGGFRTNFLTVPEEELVIMILTNYNRANPGGKTLQVFDIMIDEPSVQEETTSPEVKYKSLTTSELKSFENYFWNPVDKYVRRIYVKNDTLMYYRGENNESQLAPVGKKEFKMLGIGGINLLVSFEGKGEDARMIVKEDDLSPSVFYSFTPEESSEEEMKSYVGTYYSPELDVYYKFLWKENELVWYHQRRGYGTLSRVKKDALLTSEFMSEFERNEAGEVIGAKFSSGRVRNLRMVKVE